MGSLLHLWFQVWLSGQTSCFKLYLRTSMRLILFLKGSFFILRKGSIWTVQSTTEIPSTTSLRQHNQQQQKQQQTNVNNNSNNKLTFTQPTTIIATTIANLRSHCTTSRLKCCSAGSVTSRMFGSRMIAVSRMLMWRQADMHAVCATFNWESARARVWNDKNLLMLAFSVVNAKYAELEFMKSTLQRSSC